jgi:hypothetical protein
VPECKSSDYQHSDGHDFHDHQRTLRPGSGLDAKAIDDGQDCERDSGD